MLPKSDVGVTIYDDERTALLSAAVAALQEGSQSYLPSGRYLGRLLLQTTSGIFCYNPSANRD